MFDERLGPPPELAPLPGQADAALRLVHARRRRSGGVLASSAAVAALLSLLVSATGDGRAIVEPSSPYVSQLAPGSLTAERRLPSGAPSPSTALTPAGTPSRAGAVPTARAARRQRPHAPVAAPARGDDRSVASRIPVTRTTRRAVNDCVHQGQWCPTLSTGSPPERIDVIVGACRAVLSGRGTLTFAAEEEIDLVAFRDGREVWRWTDAAPLTPRAHVVAADAGQCIEWTISWDFMLDDGTPAPAGSYVLRPRVLATEEVPAGEVHFEIS